MISLSLSVLVSATCSRSKACNYGLPRLINSSWAALHLVQQHMQHTPDHTCNHVVESDGRKCNYKRGGQVGKIRAAMLLFGRGRSNDYLKLFLTRAVYSEKNKIVRLEHSGPINVSCFSLSFPGFLLYLYTGLSVNVQCYFKPPFPVEQWITGVIKQGDKLPFFFLNVIPGLLYRPCSNWQTISLSSSKIMNWFGPLFFVSFVRSAKMCLYIYLFSYLMSTSPRSVGVCLCLCVHAVVDVFFNLLTLSVSVLLT